MRVFVLTTPARVDDSTEALHQLVHTANGLGYDAATVYLPGPAGDPTPAPYRCYLPTVAADAVDASTSFVVAAPRDVAHLLDLRGAQRGLWWLGDDPGDDREPAAVSDETLQALNSPRSKCIQLTQSEQHRKDLAARGTACLTLTDYVPDHLVALGEQARDQPKDDLVVYDAPPAGTLARELRSRLPESAQWVPLPAQDPAGAARTLAQAKVFLDLTGSAGGSRIARTATLAGCCVLASGRPAVADDPGRSVPDRYRIPDDERSALAGLPALIADVLADPGSHLQHFGERRGRIEGQKRTFTNEVFVALATVEAFQHRVQHLAL